MALVVLFLTVPIYAQQYTIDESTQNELTVNSNLLKIGGYHYLPGINPIALFGTANTVTTRSVLVNGHLAEWSQQEGTWSIKYSDFYPGINRIIVKTLDGQNGTGSELEHKYIDIWCEIGPTNDYPKDNDSEDQIPVADLKTKLMVRNSYLPGIGILVRIEVMRPDGNIERDLWNATATLSVDNFTLPRSLNISLTESWNRHHLANNRHSNPTCEEPGR